jgi:hypothetical protein
MPLTEDHCLLGCDTMKSGSCLLIFKRNILSPFSGQKSKPNMAKCDMDVGGVITRLRTLSEPIRVRKETGTKGHSLLK